MKEKNFLVIQKALQDITMPQDDCQELEFSMYRKYSLVGTSRPS